MGLEESKIIVVVIVAVIILAGLAGFLFYMEHRLRRSEKRLRELQKERTP